MKFVQIETPSDHWPIFIYSWLFISSLSHCHVRHYVPFRVEKCSRLIQWNFSYSQWKWNYLTHERLLDPMNIILIGKDCSRISIEKVNTSTERSECVMASGIFILDFEKFLYYCISLFGCNVGSHSIRECVLNKQPLDVSDHQEPPFLFRWEVCYIRWSCYPGHRDTHTLRTHFLPFHKVQCRIKNELSTKEIFVIVNSFIWKIRSDCCLIFRYVFNGCQYDCVEREYFFCYLY